MDLPTDLPVPASRRLRTLLQVDLALLELSGRLVGHWSAHAAAHGLTSAQVKVLLCLWAEDVVSMRALATRLDYDASNLTTLVDKLDRRGLIARNDDGHDRRRKSVRLTDDGLALRDSFWRSLTSDAGPLAALTHAQLDDLRELLIQALSH